MTTDLRRFHSTGARKNFVHATLGQRRDCERGIGKTGRSFNESAIHHVETRVMLHLAVESTGLAKNRAAERMRGDEWVKSEC